MQDVTLSRFHHPHVGMQKQVFSPLSSGRATENVSPETTDEDFWDATTRIPMVSLGEKT